MDCKAALERLDEEISSIKNTDAKNRLLALFDEGTILELDKFTKNGSDPSSVYTAYGLVGGSPCYAFSQDISVCYGAMGKMQAKKIKRVFDLAVENVIPLEGIYDSNGGQVSEGIEVLEAYSELISSAAKLSGVVPMISVISGTCIGSSAVLASLADFIILTKDSEFYVNSPKILENSDSLAGTAENAFNNGTASLLAENVEEALCLVQNLFTYLPQNNLAVAPFVDYVPAAAFDNSTVDAVISSIVDGESFFELKKAFATDIKIGFARMCGNSIGIVATASEDSYISASGSKKAANFVRLCDAFSIPIVTLVDCKGFLGKIENELAGDVKAVASLTHAYAEATTPKISIITGYAIGAGFIALAGRASGADSVLAWPCSKIGTLEPCAAVQLLYKDALAEGKSREELEKDYEDNECSPFVAAAEGFIDDVIKPEETALKVIKLLEMLSGKRVNTLSKKHSNMPL